MGLFDKFKKKSTYDIKMDNEQSFKANANTYYEAYNRYGAKDYKTAFRLFSKAAKGHHMVARYMMGTCYEDGLGVERDYRKAYEIYSGIADYYQQNWETFYFDSNELNRFGVSFSKFRIGLFYMWGRVVPQDTNKAIEIFSNMDTRYDHQEAVFLSQRELLFNYVNGSNGFPQSYGQAHNRALRAIEIYDNYKLPDKNSVEKFRNVNSQFHFESLQFVAYNLENGRGVQKKLDAGTKYRRRAAQEYRNANEAYWTGRNYEQLGDDANAKKMYQLAIDLNNDQEYKQKAQERLGNIVLREENRKIGAALKRIEEEKKSRKEFMEKLENNPSRSILYKATWLYYYGTLNYRPDWADGRYVPIDRNKNHRLALEYLLRLIKSEVTDTRPLPPAFGHNKALYSMMMGKTKEETLEDYVRIRMQEKRGFFETASFKYTLGGRMVHIESTFRMAQMQRDVMGNADYAEQFILLVEKEGRPVYGRYTEPTRGLVQLVQQQDPEAMLDLARIYRGKKDYDSLGIAEILTDMATDIYQLRADACDPEATYALVELKHRKKKNGMYYLMKASLLSYAKAYADLSSDAFSDFFNDVDRAQMSKTAIELGAKLTSYVSYFDKKEFNDALNLIDAEQKRSAKDGGPMEAIENSSFMKLYNFMQTGKPFYDEEMQRLIKNGIVDDCGDKPLADMIKKLAGRGLGEINKETIQLAQKGLRDALGADL